MAEETVKKELSFEKYNKPSYSTQRGYEALKLTLGSVQETYNSISLKLNEVLFTIKDSTTQLFVNWKEREENHLVDLANVIIEYRQDLIREPHIKTHVGRQSYFEHFVSIGLPEHCYNWILKQATALRGLTIDRNRMVEVNGYVWTYAVIDSTEGLGCYIYSNALHDLTYIGRLNDIMHIFKSNITGVGHFEITIVKSRNIRLHLKFKLKKFQLINTTSTSSKVKNLLYIEPPEEILRMLSC